MQQKNKTCIIYYSLTGNTELIANILQQELSADIIKINPDDEIPKDSWTRYFWGGKSVFFNEKPVLLNHFPDFSNYSTIFLGTPVWSHKLAPALNAFLDQFQFPQQKVCLFASYHGGGEKKCFDLIKSRLNNSIILSQKAFKNPTKLPFNEQKILVQDWLSEIHF